MYCPVLHSSYKTSASPPDRAFWHAGEDQPDNHEQLPRQARHKELSVRGILRDGFAQCRTGAAAAGTRTRRRRESHGGEHSRRGRRSSGTGGGVKGLSIGEEASRPEERGADWPGPRRRRRGRQRVAGQIIPDIFIFRLIFVEIGLRHASCFRFGFRYGALPNLWGPPWSCRTRSELPVCRAAVQHTPKNTAKAITGRRT